MVNLTRDEIIWLAGFYDGEGSPLFREVGLSYETRVSVSQNSESLMNQLQTAFGFGRVSNPSGNGGFVFTVEQHKDKILFLTILLPYLIVRRHESKYLLRYLILRTRNFNSKIHDPEELVAFQNFKRVSRPKSCGLFTEGMSN